MQSAASQLIWHKSSYSSTPGGNCVEVAVMADGGVAVRDSKDPNGPTLRFKSGFFAFAASLKR